MERPDYLTDVSSQDVELRFSYHAPKAELFQIARYAENREQAKAYARWIVENCPATRERSLALTHLEEVVMWANAAIARNE